MDVTFLESVLSFYTRSRALLKYSFGSASSLQCLISRGDESQFQVEIHDLSTPVCHVTQYGAATCSPLRVCQPLSVLDGNIPCFSSPFLFMY